MNTTDVSTAISLENDVFSTTANLSINCDYHKKMLTFDTSQLIRVCLTWFLFLVSASGNLFILYCVLTRNRKSHVHVITTHLVIANLVFTFISMPLDAVWNTTMSWKAGSFACKICQLLKQFGMYVSSLMVVMIAADRAVSILAPMANINNQRKLVKIFLICTWINSFLFAIPAAVFFDVKSAIICPEKGLFTQCVDFAWMDQEKLNPYYFHTMCFSFIIPFITTVFSYSLVLWEINSMQLRDIRIVGRRASRSSNIARARKKTFILMSAVSLAFILFWGPYYAIAIINWFKGREEKYDIPREVSNWLLILLYANPAVHPFIYGAFMRDVRHRFFYSIRKIFCLYKCCKSLKRKKIKKESKMENRIQSRSKNICNPFCRGKEVTANINEEIVNQRHLLVHQNGTESSSSTPTHLTATMTTRYVTEQIHIDSTNSSESADPPINSHNENNVVQSHDDLIVESQL